MKKRRIAVTTGARAEYGYLKPLMKAIAAHPGLELLLYVTGLHLVKEYGNTAQEIVNDGFQITESVDMDIRADNSDRDMGVSIGKGVSRFSEVLDRDRPDILVVFGDRIEALAAAVAGAAVNIPVAHIAGGEVGLGDIDDSIRHAITKFAHLHFTSSEKSRERVLKLGEENWRVYRVGALSLDAILNEELLSKKELETKYSLGAKDIILICYHPTTTEWQEAENQMRLVMAAVLAVAEEKKMAVVVLYPNAYPGGFQIVNVIREYARHYDRVHVFESVPHLDFVSMMKASSVFVGNSSSGIIEAPSLGVPYVCIGTRQQGRERAKNVIDVAYHRQEIGAGITRALSDKEFLKGVAERESPYGDGGASGRILEVLSKIEINRELLQKKLTY